MMRNRALVAMVAIVLCANLGSLAYLGSLAAHNPDAAAFPIMKGDPQAYALLADNLLSQHAFTENGQPERHWTPGYPFFLAATKAISGGWWLAIFLQIALSLGALALVYRMALRFLAPRWALVPPLLYGLDPAVVLANTSILSDSLFASLLIATMYVAFFADVRGREALRWVSVGLLLGMLTLIRPIAEFLVPLGFLLLFYLLVRGGWRHARKASAVLALYSCAALIVIGPWVGWNHAKFGVYEVAHVGASNLLYYNVRDFLAWKEMNATRPVPAILASRYLDDPAYADVDKKIAQALQAATPPGADQENYDASVAERFILQDPLHYAYFHLVNTAPFFLGSSIAAYGQEAVQLRDNSGFYAPTMLALVQSFADARAGDWRGLLSSAPIALEVVLWAFIVASALYGLFQKRREPLVWMLALSVAYFAILTGPVSIVRYRIPSEAFLFILATIGLDATLKRIFHDHRRTQ